MHARMWGELANKPGPVLSLDRYNEPLIYPDYPNTSLVPTLAN